jgi:cytochrome c oxidase assembly protein subunit 11
MNKAVSETKSAGLNWRMFGKLAVIVSIMFTFGWALVPIYKAICEVTGINVLTKTDKAAQDFARNTQVDNTRTITVEFDANGRGPWQFKPEKSSLEVRPGELATMVYTLVNTQDQPTAGQAIPSYAPKHSGQYFRKIECFCFKQQALQAKEVKQFPVVFVVDPNLPKDVNTITLSYTFFEVAGLGKSAQTPAATVVVGSGS